MEDDSWHWCRLYIRWRIWINCRLNFVSVSLEYLTCFILFLVSWLTHVVFYFFLGLASVSWIRLNVCIQSWYLSCCCLLIADWTSKCLPLPIWWSSTPSRIMHLLQSVQFVHLCSTTSSILHRVRDHACCLLSVLELDWAHWHSNFSWSPVLKSWLRIHFNLFYWYWWLHLACMLLSYPERSGHF